MGACGVLVAGGGEGYWPERSTDEVLTRSLCPPAFSRKVERGGSLFGDFDVIDEVGSLAEASRGEIAILFVVQDQSFSHGL